MPIDIIGKLGDPVAVVAAAKPVLDEEEAKVMDAIVERVVPALQTALTTALTTALDGLVVTITVSKKAAQSSGSAGSAA